MGASHTRERIINAAERLIAQHGCAGVSLRQIARAAGERNHGAVQYHFGSQDGLIDAVLQHRAQEIDRERSAMLEALEADGRATDLHALVTAAILPLAKLVRRQGPGGGDYLLFMGEVLSVRARKFPLTLAGPAAPGALRIRDRIRRCLADLPEPLQQERLNLMVLYVNGALSAQVHAARYAETESVPSALDTMTFVGNLVDTVVAALRAPVSRRTEATLRQLCGREA